MVNWNTLPIDLSWAFVLTTIEPANDWKPLKIRHKHGASPC